MKKNIPKNYYSTNTEIAEKFGVSEGAVRNWIKGAKEGRNNLQIEEYKGKSWVLDSPHNAAELERLSKIAVKYKSPNEKKSTLVEDSFYTIFKKDEEVVEIINDLREKKEINLKYTYRQEGAGAWDKFYKSMTSPITNSVNNMVLNSFNDIAYYLKDNDLKINFLDIGCGNAYPVKDLIKTVNKEFTVNEYVAIDISNEVCNLAVKNIKNWFPDIAVRKSLADVEFTRFDKIFAENSILYDNSKNLIIFIGNTISNLDDITHVLKNFRSGMTTTDFLLFTFTLDNIQNRSSLNYQVQSHNFNLKKWIPDLIGIDTDKCEVLLNFNENKGCKEMFFVLDKDYEINFKVFNKINTVVLSKGDKINVWKHYIRKPIRLFKKLEEVGFEILTYKTDREASNGMVFCKTKNDY